MVLLIQKDSHSVLLSRKYGSQPSTMDLYIRLFKPGGITRKQTQRGRSRHTGDRGAGQSVVSPFPADRQASGSQAESSRQKQKSISSLPGPGEQSLQVSLAQAQGHPIAAGRERDIPGTGLGGCGGAGAYAGSRGLAHLCFCSGLGSGAPFFSPSGETRRNTPCSSCELRGKEDPDPKRLPPATT